MPIVASAPASAPALTPLAAVTGSVPHYSGVAVVTGSLIFLVLVSAFVGVVMIRRRR